MRFTTKHYEFAARRRKSALRKKVTYCRSYQELDAAVRAAGIDIWLNWQAFEDDCYDAGIELDTRAGMYWSSAPSVLRNAELDGKFPEDI